VIAILREFRRVSTRGVFVIDLHRHPVAYYFYITIGRLFLHNRLIQEDGALSILRGFMPEELLELAQRAGLEDPRVECHFPYRLVLAASAKPPFPGTAGASPAFFECQADGVSGSSVP